MKQINIILIWSYLIIFLFTSCKKNIIEIFPPNKSFVECVINGQKVRGEGIKNLFEQVDNAHMNYYYNDKDTFTFNIDKIVGVSSVEKDKRNYNICISVCLNTLPVLGRKYHLSEYGNKQIPYEFIDNSFLAKINLFPYIYEYADTLDLPKEIRKKQLSIVTDKADGYIEFTKIDVENRNISGKFEFEAEATSKYLPNVLIKLFVKEGIFEGYHLPYNKIFYSSELPETVL